MPHLAFNVHEGPCAGSTTSLLSTMPDIDPLSILDPILSYLSSVLPPPVYSVLLTVSSHTFTLLTTLISLTHTFIASRPWEWDAYTILPMLISIFTAYLALLNLWRTASWMVRTSVWFVKWGTLLGALAAGLGWMAGGGAGPVGAGVAQAGLGLGGGMARFLGGLVWEAVNGPAEDAAGGSRSSTRASAKSKSKGAKQKAWEPFQQHRDWQYNDNNNANGREGNGVVQDIIGNIVGAAERGGWLDAAKSALDGFQNAGAARDSEEGSGARRKQPSRKAKTGSR